MPKSPYTCDVCNGELHPRDPGVTCVGFTGAGKIYRHGGQCQETAELSRLNTVTCRGCRRGFQRRSEAGRPAEFCDEKCRKRHVRGVARTWRQAAKGDMPDSVEESIQRINAVGALFRDLNAGRFNGSSPSAARETLIAYTRRLERHRDELVEKQKLERERRRVEAMREVVGARRKADEDAWSIFLAAQEEESK
jgi:hypothetical protein